MEDLNFRKGDAKTDVFGSDRMLQPLGREILMAYYS